MNNKVSVYPTSQEAAHACAQSIVEAINDALDQFGVATLAISGGSTPKPMFEALAKADLPWDLIHLFFVDERPVPPDHDQSNYKLALASLIEPSGIPEENVHRIEAELGAEAAAAKYAAELRDFFELEEDETPVFSAIHLGMGPDAHTASLFPGVPEIENQDQLVGAPFVEKLNTHRITLMPRVLIEAENTFFLLAGADKADPLKHVMHGAYDPAHYPAQLLRQHGHLVSWFIDEQASALLPPSAVIS